MSASARTRLTVAILLVAAAAVALWLLQHAGGAYAGALRV
jgi:hypothetical protein